jgi:hypothetical protein
MSGSFPDPESASDEDGVAVPSYSPTPINPNNHACLSRASPFVMRSAIISLVGQYSTLINRAFFDVVPDEVELDVKVLHFRVMCGVFGK